MKLAISLAVTAVVAAVLASSAVTGVVAFVEEDVQSVISGASGESAAAPSAGKGKKIQGGLSAVDESPPENYGKHASR